MQILDIALQLTHFEWTLHKGRGKNYKREQTDAKKTEPTEYRRNENQWKTN